MTDPLSPPSSLMSRTFSTSRLSCVGVNDRFLSSVGLRCVWDSTGVRVERRRSRLSEGMEQGKGKVRVRVGDTRGGKKGGTEEGGKMKGNRERERRDRG